MMFVSYSRTDIAATRALVETLSTEGIECWLDESNIPVGQAFVERLGMALREADCFLHVDTPASRSSYWVSRELQTSFRYRRDGRYHSTLRLYSSDCKHADAADWDASVLLNQDAPIHIAKFIAGRRTALVTPDLDDERGSVKILNDAGLGQPSNWTGRQDELRALDEWWFGSFSGAWLCGLGGSGKSGLLQTWITALSYLGYGEPVSASVLYLRGSEIDVTEARHTLNTLELNVASPLQLLLVVDGYDEAHNTPEVEDLLVQASHIGVRTLVTSRTSVPPLLSGCFTNIEIGSMTRRDSVAMLNEFGVSGPERVELAEELGDHPLALLLLSRSLASGNKSAVEVLSDLRSMRGGVSDGGVGTSPSIRATLGNSVQSLTSDARTLLETLCRSVEDVPSPADLQDPAIRELANASLIQVDHLETPKQVSIHPLVRGYINEEQSATRDGVA